VGTRIQPGEAPQSVDSRPGLDVRGRRMERPAHVVAREARLIDAYDSDELTALLESLLPPEKEVVTEVGRDTSGRMARVAPPLQNEMPPLSAFSIERPQTQSHPAPRVRSVTSRLAEAGRLRPVVHVPARHTSAEAPRTRSIKLPPVWILANLVILLVAGFAIAPRILPVDAASGCAWHTVVPGDTLGNLGWQNHTNALAIAHANHIANPNLIFVGQKLCIPMTQWAQTSAAPARPAPAVPPTYGSASNVREFIQLALPYARQAHTETGWPTSVILAQWGLEHGWRIPGFTGFNWGNVAALPGEPTVNGIAVPGSPPRFAYASTPQAGLNDYVRVAHLGYYSAVAPAGQAGGADAAARALGRSPWDAGHYTDHGDPGSSLISILRVYNLYWYDTH